ncbi:hypothetical protein MK974_24385 [Burkholderia ambifaria]|uniref:hypothetical protein n=1 Tax=Burkholderia ambifaria TaxID=152480 RepID=UPI0022A92BCD|nr:hypothetical protein [Burkholderia ambifaria]WAS56241.1 hypothetical protein MK974_24385 [Burkholderia ambifaria]
MTTEATLTLSADQQAVAQKKVRDLHHAVGTILSVLRDSGEIDAELATNCVKVAEFNLADLCKALGVETFSAAEREQRYAELRKANFRIRNLEAQIGATLSPEATQHAIKNIAERLNNWWRHEGFGYVHELNFGAYGVCHGEFTCSLRGSSWLLDSDTPVTDKETRAAWIESVRVRGFELIKDGREWAILDCDASRKALLNLIAMRLPSAKVFKFSNVSRDNAKGFVLRHAEICVYELAEIMALPVAQSESQS